MVAKILILLFGDMDIVIFFIHLIDESKKSVKI